MSREDESGVVNLFTAARDRLDGDTRASRTSDEETVRSLDDQARIAALNRDIPTLERLWSSQLTVNAPNNRVVIGKRAVLDSFGRSGIINFSSFERQIEFIRIDGDFAIIMGAEPVRPISDAPTAGLAAADGTAALHQYLEEGRGLGVCLRVTPK